MKDHSTSDDSPQTPQDYWQQWLAFNHQVLNSNSPEIWLKNMSTNSPWAQALDFLWQALSPSISKENQEVLQKFIEQGKSYFSLNEEFLKVFQQLSAMDSKTENWQCVWEKGFIELQNHFSQAWQSGQKTLGFWELPLNNWQRTFSTLFGLPDDMFQHLKNQTPPEICQLMMERIQQLFYQPNQSINRRWQEQVRQGMQLWTAYQKAQEAYIGLFNRIGLRTIDCLRDEMMNQIEQGKSFETLRAVYDLWVDCGEKTYGEFIMTEEYGQIYADLINTLMAWKQYERQRVDEWMAAFNIPNCHEFEMMAKRVQQMRREQKMLQSSLQNPSLKELRLEIQELRAELTELKNSAHTHQAHTTRKKETLQSQKSQKNTPPSKSNKNTGE
jgi:class III poly(R)-hydroxyalkanoic acid synthase PhaE subunit